VHILEYFQDKAVGAVDDVSGLFHGIKYNIWCMKELEYVMQIMATGGSLSAVGGKKVKRFWRSGGEDNFSIFTYARPFEWHFKF